MEHWTPWEPTVELPSGLYIQNVQTTHEGLEIILSSFNSCEEIKVLFVHGADAYRLIRQIPGSSVFEKLSREYLPEFYKDKNFFKIMNSNYVKSLAQISAGLSELTEFDHFCIIDHHLIIDVLTIDVPKVSRSIQ